MNVLIVSENFLNGGLETQISTTVNALSNKVNFFFAFREYNENWNLNNVYTNFNFSYNSTVSQFCDDINNLIKIIKEKNINLLHVHPFFSLFPAVFAAKLCNIPIVYTYHGISSYSFTSGINDSILFNMILDYELDKIFCVSMEGKHVIENNILNKNKCIFLPNSIDTQLFSQTKINANKSWALISRLDIDKLNELSLIINEIQNLDINELHIYGNGSEEQNLKNYIKENNLENKIFFEGYHNNLYLELQEKYNGIIGIGRSVMEAISMNYPVILLGYNKISGVVDDAIYSFLKEENFSNKLLPSITISTLNEQLTSLYNSNYTSLFYNDFKNNFDSQLVSNHYYEELLKTNPVSSLNLKAFLDDLNSINKDDLFYSSTNVYYLLRKYLLCFCRMPHQKDLFINSDNIINKTNMVYNSIDSIKTTQDNNFTEYNNKLLDYNNRLLENNNKILEHDNQIDEIAKNTMTLSNLKRKIKYKFKHKE